jgi:hypothetical protein
MAFDRLGLRVWAAVVISLMAVNPGVMADSRVQRFRVNRGENMKANAWCRLAAVGMLTAAALSPPACA